MEGHISRPSEENIQILIGNTGCTRNQAISLLEVWIMHFDLA